MKSIKFAHISDFHLGYTQYNLAKRFTDIGNAASISVEKALERNVDFILFTGDLFHSHSPSSGALRQAIKILEMPKKANIPFYVIRGNHDASYARSERYGGDVLDFLSDLGYLHYIKDSYIDHDPLRIWGVGYYGLRTKKRLLEVLENRKKEDGEELPEWETIKDEETKKEVEDLSSSVKSEEKISLTVESEKTDVFKGVDSIDSKTAILLYNSNIKSIDDLNKISIRDLIKIKGINRKTAKKIIKEVSTKLNNEIPEFELIEEKKEYFEEKENATHIKNDKKQKTYRETKK